MFEIKKNKSSKDTDQTLSLIRLSGILFLIFIYSYSLAGEKIDTVYYQKGDRITGEVKSLDNNLLKLSTDDSGTISIEWNKIDSLFILNPMRVTMMNGEIRYGTISPSGRVGEGNLNGIYGTISEIKLWNIVELIPLEKRFIDRLSGTISSGFSYVKASDVAKLDFAGNLQYKGEKLIFQADYNIVLTRESTGTTQRQSGGATLYRVLPKNWSLQGRILGESNSYFELDLRTTLALGINYFIVRDNKQRLSAGTGLLANREFSGVLARNNFESIIQFTYMLFLFESPEVSVNFQGNLIPGLTEFGRLRSETDTNVKWEVFNDFYLKLSFYDSFDNQPLSGVKVRNDWGFTLGLEYKF